jgi:hypothetical protein
VIQECDALHDDMHVDSNISDEENVSPTYVCTLPLTLRNQPPALTSAQTNQILHYTTPLNPDPFISQKCPTASTAHSVTTNVNQVMYSNGIKYLLQSLQNTQPTQNNDNPLMTSTPLTTNEYSDQILTAVAIYADLACHNDRLTNE